MRISFILLVLFISSLVFSTTYQVNTTAPSCMGGGVTSYIDIQSAIDVASAGDVIYVCYDGGTIKSQNTNVTKAISIYGNQSNVLVNSSDSSLYVFTVTSSNVNISNLTIMDGNRGVYATSVSSVAVVNNNFINDSDGIYFSTVTNGNVSDNNISTSHYGIFASFGIGTYIVNNTINSSDTGVYLTTVANYKIKNNTIISGTEGFHFTGNGGVTNTISGNIANGSTTCYFFSSATSFTATNNIATACTTGFNVFTSSGITVSSNTAYNSGIGFHIYGTPTSNTMTFNTAYNNTDGFMTDNINGFTLSSNTAYNNSEYGIRVSISRNIGVHDNIIFNNSDAGIEFDNSPGSGPNLYYNNTIYNHVTGKAAGIYITGATSTGQQVFDNPVIQNNTYGVYVASSTGSVNVTNNTVTLNNYGFYFLASRNNNLTSNNASNNTVQYLFDSSNSTLSGINYAQLTPAGGLDINISNNSNVTTLVGSTYNNFTTSYGTIFFDSAINVSIKLMNLSDSGATATGCDSTAFSVCTLITNNNNLVNITNNSATATISLGMFYNSTLAASQMNLSKYNSTSAGWVNLSINSIDTQNYSVLLNNIVSFSTYGIVAFTPVSTTTTTTASDSGTPTQTITITPSPGNTTDNETTTSEKYIHYRILQPENMLEVVTNIYDGLLRLILVSDSSGFYRGQMAEKASGGTTLFDLPEQGSYTLEFSKSGYSPQSFSFTYASVAPQEFTVTTDVTAGSTSGTSIVTVSTGVAGATVIIRDSNGNVVAQGTSDSSGNISFTVNDGTYTVEVSRDGYTTQTMTIVVGTTSTTTGSETGGSSTTTDGTDTNTVSSGGNTTTGTSNNDTTVSKPDPVYTITPIIADNQTTVGETVVIETKKDGVPLVNSKVVVTGPDGKETLFTSGSDGTIKIPLTIKGTYIISVKDKSGKVLRTLKLIAADQDLSRKTQLLISSVLKDDGKRNAVIASAGVISFAGIYLYLRSRIVGNPLSYKRKK